MMYMYWINIISFQGCDGSILIENGPQSERHAFGHQGVRGFEDSPN